MKIPQLQNSEKYVSLYVIDFGDHAGVGFTAEEVAELFESEKFSHCKAYKICRARPDGTLELKGVLAQTFQLEAGMFFHSATIETAKADFKKLTDLAVTACPPCRAKVHLAEFGPDKFAVALIYPAEYDDQVSSWLLDADFKTSGPAAGGVGAVQSYYDQAPEILDRCQLFASSEFDSRTGEDLLANLKVAVQR